MHIDCRPSPATQSPPHPNLLPTRAPSRRYCSTAVKQDHTTHSEPHPPQDAEQRALCPYCGHENPAAATQCAHCRGLFEPLSRQASQNAMGPWFVRDPQRPFQPGMSFATLRNLIARNKVNRRTILRGPTTRQFWAYAEDTPGVATLLCLCHACHAKVRPDEFLCRACNSTLSPQNDRQHLGLAPVRLLPGQGTPEEIAQAWTTSAKTTEKQSQKPPSPQTITTARPSTPAPITTVTTSAGSPDSGAPDQQNALRRARRPKRSSALASRVSSRSERGMSAVMTAAATANQGFPIASPAPNASTPRLVIGNATRSRTSLTKPRARSASTGSKTGSSPR